MEPVRIPARMLNEVVYCPRLYALEHINGEWAASADTVRGATVHRRVDRPSRANLPEAPSDDTAPVVVRSVTLGNDALGLVARIDLVEASGMRVVPVDYKKGTVPDTPDGAWLPERVQICAQALLLWAHEYECTHGALYFAGSRRRVNVPITSDLVRATLAAVEQAKEILASETLPPPLVDSPKCWGCSLVGLCLPDEQNLLNQHTAQVRPLAPPREEGLPLYIEQRGAKLSRRGGELIVKANGEVVDRVRVVDTTRVIVRGAVSVTTPLVASLAEAGITLALHGWSGRWVGSFVPAAGHNVLGRLAQFRTAADPRLALPIARSIVNGKISNQRVLLRRNGRSVPRSVLDGMRSMAEQSLDAPSIESLYGIEGQAARLYFQHFTTMIKDTALQSGFDLDGRNRRPPKDPVNALLSMAYAFLTREVANLVGGIGLDPWVGFLHRPRPGKPALALDLMEEFRPVIADSVVLTLINKGILGIEDFEVARVGVTLGDPGRKKFIRAFETRMAQETRHPAFATSMTYRRIVEVQARLLCKSLLGEIPAYPPLKVR